MTYEQLQGKRRMAEQLLSKRNRAPRNVGEGLAAIGDALLYRSTTKKADKRDAELRGEFDSEWDLKVGGGMFGGAPAGDASGYGGSGGTYTPPEPPNAADMKYPTGQTGPAPEGNFDAAANVDMGSPVVMDLPTGIKETAAALEMDPHDLATMISYETAGTFDPAKKGPTTQWGQHRGLIQFGEPQAEQYGVNWEDPLGSQLGSNGAIVKYFKENGWKPGMGLMDAYSIINAGGPGRYNASDANNGGAPGTVADKVNNQMAGHQEKAAALLGGSFEPGPGTQTAQTGQMGAQQQGGPAPQQGRISIQDLAKLASSPYASAGQKALASQMMQQQMQANDPNAQLDLQLKQAQLNKLQNPQAKERNIIKANDGFSYYQDDGSRVLPNVQASKNDPLVSIINGDQVDARPMADKPAKGFQRRWDQGNQTWVDEPIPGGSQDTTKQDALVQESAARSGGIVTEDIGIALDSLKDNGNWAAGMGSFLQSIPGTEAKSLSGLLQTIKANVGFDRLQQMRDASKTGGALGAINKSEMDLLQAVMGSLDQSQSPEDLMRNLNRVNDIYLDIIYGKNTFESAGKVPPPPGQNRFSGMSDSEFSTIDIKSLTPQEVDQLFEARQ